jgi:hypothetical protein
MDNDLRASPQGRFRLNEQSVVADIIDGETVIMNLEAGHYYSLNASGGEIWLLLLAGLSRGEVLAAIVERHGAGPSTAEIDAFIGRLVEHRLIVATEQESGANGLVEQELPELSAWMAPEISVYTDLKDMLALDPPLPQLATNRG